MNYANSRQAWRRPGRVYLRMTKRYEIYSGRRAVSVEHSISPLQAALDYARSFGFADDEIRRVGVDSVAWQWSSIHSGACS